MIKAEIIQRKIEEGKLSVNEARILQDLKPIEGERSNEYYLRLDALQVEKQTLIGIDFAIGTD